MRHVGALVTALLYKVPGTRKRLWDAVVVALSREGRGIRRQKGTSITKTSFVGKNNHVRRADAPCTCDVRDDRIT